jgi:hypothetical protein
MPRIYEGGRVVSYRVCAAAKSVRRVQGMKTRRTQCRQRSGRSGDTDTISGLKNSAAHISEIRRFQNLSKLDIAKPLSLVGPFAARLGKQGVISVRWAHFTTAWRYKAAMVSMSGNIRFYVLFSVPTALTVNLRRLNPTRGEGIYKQE